MPINRPVTPAEDLTATLFEDVDIWLPELYAANTPEGVGPLTNRTFVRCRVQGPAVMVVGPGTTFEDTNFGPSGGDPSNLALRPVGTKIVGAIPMADCRFVGCEFFNLGFTGSPAFIDSLLALPESGA